MKELRLIMGLLLYGHCPVNYFKNMGKIEADLYCFCKDTSSKETSYTSYVSINFEYIYLKLLL